MLIELLELYSYTHTCRQLNTEQAILSTSLFVFSLTHRPCWRRSWHCNRHTRNYCYRSSGGRNRRTRRTARSWHRRHRTSTAVRSFVRSFAVVTSSRHKNKKKKQKHTYRRHEKSIKACVIFCVINGYYLPMHARISRRRSISMNIRMGYGNIVRD